MPEDEVWRLHGNTSIEATLEVTVDGSITTAEDNGSRSVLIQAPTLTLNGNISAESGVNPNTTTLQSNATHDLHEGADGTDGGDVLLAIDILSMDESACLATGTGGNGTELIGYNTSIGSATSATVGNITYTAGSGADGGSLYWADNMTGGYDGTLWIGNGGAGGRVVTNQTYGRNVTNVTAISGAGGPSGGAFDIPKDQIDFGVPAYPVNQSTNISASVANGSGIGGASGPALAPMTANVSALREGTVDACEIHAPVCQNMVTDDPCADDGDDGDDAPDGTTQAGEDGDPGENGTADKVESLDGEPGLIDGGDAKSAEAHGQCGGDGGTGGAGGDREPDTSNVGGNGGQGGQAGADGDARAFAGAGGEGQFGDGGDGGSAEARGGAPGFSAAGGRGGNGGCNTDGTGGDGGQGGHAAGSGTSPALAKAVGGQGGRGRIDGGNGGDVLAIGGDGLSEGHGGHGGWGWQPGYGGESGSGKRDGGPHEVVPGAYGIGQIGSNGSDGTVDPDSRDGFEGDMNDSGDTGDQC